MSVTSGFFNSLSGDRKYDAIQISSMFDGLITDGIYNGFLESFMVTASDPASMVVTVGEGRCWFNHTWTLNDAPLPLTLDVGDVVLNRIDTVVIDVDSTDTVRACTIKVVKGTPSSQAVAPTLENTETHHQYPLCDISVVAGATTVTQSNITNRRGTSDCPFVATLMTTVTVDELLVQWESQWNDWMTDRTNSMDSWTAEQQEAFTTWFQTVQDILDENTAGNLLNRINHRTGINATATYSAGVVAITAPDDAGEILTFVAPSDFLSSDTYTLNGEALTITDLNGEALDDSWKKNSPVTITVSGGKAFFKAGGSGKNDTLPPLLGNMTVEVVEGDETDTYTIKMDKLILDKTTEMVGGAQLEWGEEMPAKPGKGTGGIKTWTREESIGLRLSELTEGDIVKLKENGTLVDFYVAKHDYESSLNGAGRTLVVRKDTYDDRVWDRGTVNAYVRSDLDSWFNSTYKNMLDADFRSLIGTTKIHYTPGNGNNTVGTLERAIFALSLTELGQSHTYANTEGSALPIASTLRIAYRNGSPTTQWTRSPRTDVTYDTWGLRSNGDFDYYGCDFSFGSRPAFTLPASATVEDNSDGTYTFVGEVSYVTHTVEVPHGQKVVFRQFTQNQKKQFQTMLVGGVYPPLGEVEPPFALPEFTGNHAIFGDETTGRIELYEAGELTLSPGTYDFFLVGGGSNGNNSQGGSNDGAGGGAGGYTKTVKGVVVEKTTSMISVLVGAANSKTAITIGDQSYEALPGSASSARYESGKDGGSGGGVGMYDGTGDISKFAPGLGGSDGSDGGSNNQKNFIAGKGQHTTTRAFEEEAGTLYSGAGSGGTSSGRGAYAKPAADGGGGAGGDGSASNRNGGNATPNTGGGGGGAAGAGSSSASGGHGASGILVIRWNNT